jgi:two-component system nitrate/nitrite response regulator NarL
MITCVLADDHPPILDSISRFLAGKGIDVVATAADGEAAAAAVRTHAPHVCVADLKMPRLDGLQLAARLHTEAPETAVLLYSGVADAALVSDALDAGALGFALKEGPLEDVVRAIETVASGTIYVDPILAATIATSRRSDGRALSPREREVLRLLAAGGSYAEIGGELFLSPDTIRAHAQRAMAKLGARTRTEAVAVAMRSALIA